MLQLEKERHEKQQLELEVTQLNGTLDVMKHLEGDNSGHVHEKMENLTLKLEHEMRRLEGTSYRKSEKLMMNYNKLGKN